MRGLMLFEQLKHDLRYALRSMAASPTFAALTILTLSLGIGANSAIFTFINTLLLRPLPVQQPERLVELFSLYPGAPRINGFPWRSYEHYRDHNTVFSDLIGTSATTFRVSADQSEASPIEGSYVVGNFFTALGVRPGRGRLITASDDQPQDPSPVVVVSWAYWQRAFNQDPGIVGKKLFVDNLPLTVIGVAPREFFGLQVGSAPSIWVPFTLQPFVQKARRPAFNPPSLDSLGLQLMARLKPGVSLAQARAEMSTLDRWRVEQIAATNKDPLIQQLKIAVEPGATGLSVLRDQFGRPLLLLMAVVGCLLLITCANLASMLLARAVARQREMAVRLSLGAGRFRLVRQMLTESLLLALVAGALGLLLAYVAASALVGIIASGRPILGMSERIDIPILPDLHVLLFTAGVTMLTGIVFGLAPAWSAFVSEPASTLRETVRAGESRSFRLAGRGLVIAQIALSMAVLSTAGLFLGHLSSLRTVDTGFDQRSVLLIALNPEGSGYNRVRLTAVYRELIDRLSTLPGIKSVTVSGMTPISGGGASALVTVDGFQEAPEARRRISLNGIAPKYFETFGTPFIAGRDFEFEDERRSRVAIINQSMARHYFGTTSPLGRIVKVDGDDSPYQIVGVVADVKYSELREPAPLTMYNNAFQDRRPGSQFAMRTDLPLSVVAPDVRRAVGDVLKTVAIAKMTTLSDQVDASIVPERVLAMLSGAFAGLGGLLAAIGLYGLLAYTVERRSNEIGVRMALGATRRDVTGMVLKSAAALVIIGLLVGGPMAVFGQRFAASLVGVPTLTPLSIGAAAVGMCVVALVASYLPARRAAGVPPHDALRRQ